MVVWPTVKETYLLALGSEEMANIMNMLKFHINVSEDMVFNVSEVVESARRLYIPASS